MNADTPKQLTPETNRIEKSPSTKADAAAAASEPFSDELPFSDAEAARVEAARTPEELEAALSPATRRVRAAMKKMALERALVVQEQPHTCRLASYNAMVDTCPGCGAPEADAVKAEANKNPLRHVRASRWIVHPLLQYHYLPYWPRNVSDVFATIDIKHNRVVAACVFAYPVLRSHLREGVFGLLSPETLNRDFRQLVRWMVHPDYRAQSVGSDLLKWSFAQIEQPVVEAINRSWVPIEAFQRLGMVERSEGDKHYYYRLKDCRKRVDEIKDVPVQAEPPEGAILHTYPRIWQPRLQMAGSGRIALIQPYAGSLIRTHHWDATSYTAFYDVTTTLQKVEDSAGFVEITDAKDRETILRRIAQGLPEMNHD